MVFRAGQNHPFLWLLLPLALGIVCGDALSQACSWLCFGGISAVLLLILYACSRFFFRHLYVAVLFLLLGFVGFQLAACQWEESRYDFPGREEVYYLRLCDQPEEKERSILCPARVLGVYAGDSLQTDVRQPFFLFYFPKDSAAARLARGDELLVHTRLSPPVNRGNPDEFDYERFLRRRGGSGTAYVPAGHWQVVGHDSVRTIRQMALDCRDKVVALYHRLGFRGDEWAVLSALTVGDQTDLSEDIVEAYSVAGANHVLSLSGLHIGFLYALLFVLLRPLWRRWRWLKPPLLLLVVAAMWAFAFFTGLASPVVRAVTMMSILALSTLQPERLLTLNTLAAAAFLMLLFRPLWLFDVSFQLSFLSLAAILLFQPPLYALWKPRCRLLRYVWGLLTVSMAAQVGTVPLVLLYFSRFSTHFLLSNLWVVPLSSLILYAAVLLLLLTPFPVWQVWWAGVLEKLLWVQNEGLRWISRLPYASFDHLWVDVWDVWLFYLFLALLCLALRRFTYRRVFAALLSLLVLVACHQVSRLLSLPRRSLVFYNVSRAPAVHCVDTDGCSWLVGPDSLPDVSRLSRSLEPHWTRLHLKPPVLVPGDYEHPKLFVDDGILLYGGRNVCILSDDRWQGKVSASPLPVDYLYVCRGYKGRLSDLDKLFDVRFVVFDASFSGYYLRRMADECIRRGIPYHIVARQGALRVFL